MFKTSYWLLLFCFILLTAHAEGQQPRQHDRSSEAGQSEVRVVPTYTDSTKISLNPTLGLTYFSLAGLPTQAEADTSSTFGFAGGFLTDIGGGPVALETGALFVQTGGQSTSSSRHIEITLSYLSVPLLAKIRIWEQGAFAIHMKGGLTPQYMIDGKNVFTFGGRTATEYLTAQSTINRFDTMATIGAAVNITTGTSIFTMDVNYNRGLVSIYKTSQVFNSGFTMTGGMLF
jgi:hypothetical protein